MSVRKTFRGIMQVTLKMIQHDELWHNAPVVLYPHSFLIRLAA